jgi:hypothetical protein
MILYHKYKGKKVIFILDEYDTPLQSAYLNGYWKEAAEFFGLLFKQTFKENEFMGKALITGITRVSKESLFSPFNNPRVCSVTSPFYEDIFGFTQEEVEGALKEYDLLDMKDQVKYWYDGYQFGNKADMYNPWSIVHALDERETKAYWTTTASNQIVSYVVRHGAKDLKDKFMILMQGGVVSVRVNEDTTYYSLLASPDVVWGLLLACGYLKMQGRDGRNYLLSIVNNEVMELMETLVRLWFLTERDQRSYDDFMDALVDCNVQRMQKSLYSLSRELIGSHDGSDHEGEHDPENFYHGFVLGIVAALHNRFYITSNRESGDGRYDIMMEPLNQVDKGIIIEFKVFNKEKEKDLEGTCERALDQIEEKHYEEDLIMRGIKQIVKFGIGYKGKEVLVKKK